MANQVDESPAKNVNKQTRITVVTIHIFIKTISILKCKRNATENTYIADSFPLVGLFVIVYLLAVLHDSSPIIPVLLHHTILLSTVHGAHIAENPFRVLISETT